MINIHVKCNGCGAPVHVSAEESQVAAITSISITLAPGSYATKIGDRVRDELKRILDRIPNEPA